MKINNKYTLWSQVLHKLSIPLFDHSQGYKLTLNTESIVEKGNITS